MQELHRRRCGFFFWGLVALLRGKLLHTLELIVDEVFKTLKGSGWHSSITRRGSGCCSGGVQFRSNTEISPGWSRHWSKVRPSDLTMSDPIGVVSYSPKQTASSPF